ncbi:hypothetical protein DW1_2976 [Proteiniborus sp. DW1]|uniref:hypothetical protein n=1 Tax=Proteiniborus sp. DW1 TaxID=1889883 RepID=UPI00092E091C|nr:hypothetical protein [Proteiniborus sp. DW1]SCG84526.1 hypothetical protein DW1_2976 [Proteiniborus sp. DW1]
MANPLARVIMNNITQGSKINETRSNSAKNTYSISGLGQKDEQLLLNVMNKNLGKATGPSRTLDTLNSLSERASKSVSKPAEYNSGVNTFEKVRLEDLVKGNVKPKNSNSIDNKSNTMMTLNDLASKVKKSNNQVSTVDNQVAQQQNTKDVYVKTGVINNLEAYIPKVSLNSIGKKGSLL